MATTKGIFGLETKVKEKKIKESKSEIINLADYLIGKKIKNKIVYYKLNTFWNVQETCFSFFQLSTFKFQHLFLLSIYTFSFNYLGTLFFFIYLSIYLILFFTI